jgi:hypothetical protein
VKQATVDLRRLDVPLTMDFCPHCGRFVAWRKGTMDAHKTDGRGGLCKPKPASAQEKAA